MSITVVQLMIKMKKLEKICLHKGQGCNKEKVCNGQGKYYEERNYKEKIKYCRREVYDEISMWRTDFILQIK